MPKNTTQCPQTVLVPRPLAPESSAPTMRPPCLPQRSINTRRKEPRQWVHKHARKELGSISSHLDHTGLVNKGFIIWLSRKFFLRDTSGCPEQARWRRIWFTLPAHGASYIIKSHNNNYYFQFNHVCIGYYHCLEENHKSPRFIPSCLVKGGTMYLQQARRISGERESLGI